MDERTRLVRDLGTDNAVILRNQGLLTCGARIRYAFELVYHLDVACQAQVQAMAGGAALAIPPPDVARKVAAQFQRPGRKAPDTGWEAVLRQLDRIDPSCRN